VVLVGLGLLPPVQARGKAVAVLAEALGVSFPRPLATDVTRIEQRIDGVVGDLYSSGGRQPGIVLVPGAAPGGKDDPRAVRLARAIARAGRTVFVLQLDLMDRKFSEADIERIIDAVTWLGDRTGEQVTVLGISYGGSFGLIAGADPRLEGRIEQIAVFGAYFDLLGLVQAASTGVSVVGDRRIEWEPDPRAEEILQEAALHLVPQGQRPALRRALQGEERPQALSPETRVVYELVTNDDPAATYEIAEDLSPHARAFLDRFSPMTVADSIDAPVIALHSADDPVTPYGEAERLRRGLPHARVLRVQLFEHVDLGTSSIFEAIPELWQTWRFTSWVLAAQE
jgi:pimeloyl-ACP methyl ester carboxylesterase